MNGDDPADIAWGIKEALKDSEKARRWGGNGRKCVIQYFAWRKAAEQTLEIYEMTQQALEAEEVRAQYTSFEEITACETS